MMVHPSSHRTSKNISGDVFITRKILIFLASFDIPGSWSVTTCVESMVLPYGRIYSMVCVHVTGAIVGVALLAK